MLLSFSRWADINEREMREEIIKEIVRLKNAGMNSIDEIERLHAMGGDK